MNKSELKNGMLVELRNGNICKVYDGKLRNTWMALSLIGFTEDLKKPSDPNEDIVKVFAEDDFLSLSTKHARLIWERKEKRKLVDKEELIAAIQSKVCASCNEKVAGRCTVIGNCRVGETLNIIAEAPAFKSNERIVEELLSENLERII